MTHLVWGGVISHRIDVAVKVSTVVKASDLPTIVINLEGSTRVGSSTDGRHSRDVWESNKKWLDDSWIGSNGVRLSNDLRLKYP